MITHLISFILVFCALGVHADGNYLLKDIPRESRIVGGEPADIKDSPWQVALLRESGGSYLLSCGGSLVIKAKFILSSASCTVGTTATSWRARVSSSLALSGGELYAIRTIRNHENYGGSSNNQFDYDISLFETISDIDYNATIVRPILLPMQDVPVENGAVATIYGWGSTTNGGPAVNVLRKANTVIVSNEVCSYGYGSLITPRMICAGQFTTGGIDFCLGDTGGPLVVSNTLVGILSWGRSCAQAGYPGVSTRVASFRNWINNWT